MCQAIPHELVTKMEERLQNFFPRGDYQVYSDDGMHLNVEVSSKQFLGLSLMQQHKMVYKALHDLLQSGELHSINIKTSLQ